MSFTSNFSNIYVQNYYYGNGNSIWSTIVSNTITTSGNLNVGGGARIEGNLVVMGNIYRQDELLVGNTIIVLATDANTQAEATGAGLQVGNANWASFLWDSSANSWYTGQANINTNYIFGNGAYLTGLNFTNYSNANAANYLAVYTGNISAGNVTAAGNVTGNILVGNRANIAGNVTATGNISGNNFSGNTATITGNVTAGNVTTTGNVAANNISTTRSIASGANITAVGNISGNNISGNGLSITGNISATGNITGNNVLANGATISGSVTVSGNISGNNISANSATVAGTISGNNITANSATVSGTISANVIGANKIDVTGNVTANGNVSGTNLLGNIAAASGFDSLSTSVITTGNIQGSYIIGNGAFLTGLPASYSNANVAAYLPNYQGLISNIEFRSTSLTAAALVTNDRLLTIGGNILSYITLPDDGNANSVAAELTNHGTGNVLISSGPNDYEWIFDYTGNLFAPGNIDAGNVVSANYFVGNGAFLTGIIANTSYSNSNVADYLASNSAITILTTGNITAGNVIATGNISANTVVGTESNVIITAETYSWTFDDTGTLTAPGNISGSYIFGNGAFLTGITGGNAAPLTVSLIDDVGTISNTVNNVEFLRFDANSGFNVQSIGPGNVKISLASTFKTWVIGDSDPDQPNLVASGEDTVQFVQGNGIVFTSNNTPSGNTYKSLTINVDLSNYAGNISGDYVFGRSAVYANSIMPWTANGGLVNDTVDIGDSTYRFRNLYVGNVITPAGNVGNATQIQPATQPGESGVAFVDTLTGSPTDITAGTLYVDALNSTGPVIVDTYVETTDIIALGNLTVGDYANFQGNLKAENIAAVTNIEAQFFYGNGFFLTGLNAANIVGGYSNANVANYLPTYNGNILAGNLTVSNSVVIQGNLQVLGNTTTIEANSLVISDKDITIANGAATSSQANGAGVIVGAGNIANIVYLSTPNYWSVYPALHSPGNITSDSNVTVAGNLTANNVSIINTLTANTGNFVCCLQIGGASTIYFQGYTTSNVAEQILYQANAAQSAQLDFNIIATDPTLMGGSRQSSKILATTYGNTTEYIEYGGVSINTPVGDFTVDQSGGNVRLLVSPQTNANVSYSVLVTKLV